MLRDTLCTRIILNHKLWLAQRAVKENGSSECVGVANL